ncbi:unannotated protein [freshwater metagenome]|uniref:Unannotated protein n=1 Tax=freshwater metagenome TaxID=449393 RepID=A0A6J6XRM0_9ZZZZ
MARDRLPRVPINQRDISSEPSTGCPRIVVAVPLAIELQRASQNRPFVAVMRAALPRFSTAGIWTETVWSSPRIRSLSMRATRVAFAAMTSADFACLNALLRTLAV